MFKCNRSLMRYTNKQYYQLTIFINSFIYCVCSIQMGNQTSIQSHIQNASRTGVFQLTKCNLNEFPKEIIQLKQHLRTLDLSNNKLKLIPQIIGQFSQLKHLSLNDNRLIEINQAIGLLANLVTLNLNNNSLRSLPDSISNLTNLRSVSLSSNNLSTFPVIFCRLKNLDFLDLSRNKITQVTDQVFELQVSELNLNQNQLSILSESIADCPKLKVLRMDENCLQMSAITTKILKHSQISLLAVDGNLFELKDLRLLDGYDDYMERYTATKKKIM